MEAGREKRTERVAFNLTFTYVVILSNIEYYIYSDNR